MPEKNFKHSGDLGDIIYSLPGVKAMGGGVLYLDVTGGAEDPHVQKQSARGQTRFDETGYHVIRPLLLEQPYISDVRVWNGAVDIDVNLNAMRGLLRGNNAPSIAQTYMILLGLDRALANDPWLSLKSPPAKLEKTIAINRTARFELKYPVWEQMKSFWLPRGVFIGLELEHRVFEHTFDCHIEYHPTTNALQIAQVLAGTKLLIANQSFVMSIAIGLGTAFIQEKYDFLADCVFDRANGQYF